MTTTEPMLRRIRADELDGATRPPLDPGVLESARAIVEDVRTRRDDALRAYAERFGERSGGDPLVLGRDAMDDALGSIEPGTRALLERVAARIERFALAQRDAVRAMEIPIDGGRAGHTIEPVRSAGCYAPAGRHPLPSSALMTSVTARAAGCARVVVASPSADPVMLAAARIGGADAYLACGGAHAIAALAHGTESVEPCDMIVGPGNAWVTAAKQLVSDRVGIDMLAGPSELLVIADADADPDLVAADLLAQAEHDDDAIPMLVTWCADLPSRVEACLRARLESLGTAETARAALGNGFACVVGSLGDACAAADRIGAEHVEILARDADSIAARLRNAGALFIGADSAEVLGDYGAGPNHTLPTGGTARFRAGLSVTAFMRLRTWVRIDDPAAARGLVEDAAALATIEGLDAHAQSARARIGDPAGGTPG